MHYQFLIEDQSSSALINTLMNKIVQIHPIITYDCKAFTGVGGLTAKNTVKETKTGKLLNDLSTYLRGFNKSLQNFPAVVIVIVDNDDRNTESFQHELQNLAIRNNISVDHVFCIAVEEVEAWLLGDEKAILSAYPAAKTQVIHKYCQDSICGTWELLADVVYKGGLARFKKDCPTFVEIGKYKSEWATNIGAYMDIQNNKSPSFNKLIYEIQQRLPTTA